MGAQPAQGIGSSPSSGHLIQVYLTHAHQMQHAITPAELRDCIKRLKRGKSPGVDGILAEMIKDGGDLLETCLLWLFNCMLASHFPKPYLIVAPVRQNLKLGAAVRAPGARTERVRAPSPWCGRVVISKP